MLRKNKLQLLLYSKEWYSWGISVEKVWYFCTKDEFNKNLNICLQEKQKYNFCHINDNLFWAISKNSENLIEYYCVLDKI